MTKISQSSFLLMSLCVLVMLVTGCARYSGTNALLPSDHIQNKSYTAANKLAEQASFTITQDTPLFVGTLSDIDRVETSTALGRIIAEQVGTRFVQLGYNVSEVKLREFVNVKQNGQPSSEAGEFVLSRDSEALAATSVANAVISGTYAVGGENILVNLRLIEVDTGRVLAAHDYPLAMTADVHKLIHNKDESFGIFGQGWAQ